MASEPQTIVETIPAPVKEGIGIGSLGLIALVSLLSVLWLLSLWRNRRLTKAGQELTFDELTGVLRRAGGMAAIEREIARSRRQKTPLSVAFIDVDGLKRVNDSEGHAAGDALLRGVAGHLQERLRDSDLLFRFGGDEFVCVLPDADHISCERVFRRLRATAAEKELGFTYGVASVRPDDDASSLLARADGSLYATRAEERAINASQDERVTQPSLDLGTAPEA